MAKLIIKFNDVVIDQIVLKQGDMNIGRRPGSDILLDNLAVSANHASIFTIGDDSFIQDLNSTNGTYISNKKISKHHLVSGDIIQIGQHALLYVNEKAAKPADNLAKTVIITPHRHEEHPAAVASAPVAARAETTQPAVVAADARKGSIFILSGANSGKRIDLTMAVTNLGRAGKRAGVITRNQHGGYTLMPGDTSEKATLNGTPVAAAGDELKNGDIIEVAGSRMQFYLK